MNEEHEKYMRRALELAAKARGRTSPNPMVGCVIVKRGKIVGEGYHHMAGLPHAEVEAFDSADSSDLTGATVYVTLEPCSHQGKTPPCAPMVAKSGVSKVIVGMQDPNPLVAGRGLEILRKAGKTVECGILEDECLRLNEAFIKHITTSTPFVTLKGAVTLDGKIATASGDSKWITSETSRELVHKMRDEMDAVMIGSNTLIADDASLTCRLPNKFEDPYRVVIDSRLRTPLDSNFCKLAADGKTIIVTTDSTQADKATALEDKGCKVIKVTPGPDGRPALPLVMKELGALDINSLLVEGGGELNFSLIREGFIDKVMLFMAPKILGGREAKTFIAGDGFDKVADALPLKDISAKTIGPDILIEAYVDKVSDS